MNEKRIEWKCERCKRRCTRWYQEDEEHNTKLCPDCEKSQEVRNYVNSLTDEELKDSLERAGFDFYKNIKKKVFSEEDILAKKLGPPAIPGPLPPMSKKQRNALREALIDSPRYKEVRILKHHLEIAQSIAQYYAGRKKLKSGSSIEDGVLDTIAENIGFQIERTQEWLDKNDK